MSVQNNTLPLYVNAANVVSESLLSFTFGSTVVAAGMGAILGKGAGKPATFALQSALTDIFWKYIHPNIIQKIFVHSKSNLAGRAKLLQHLNRLLNSPMYGSASSRKVINLRGRVVDQARLIGITLSCVASVAIPYLIFAKVLLPNVKNDTPYIGIFKKENPDNNPYTLSAAVCVSIAPTTIAILRTLLTSQNWHR